MDLHSGALFPPFTSVQPPEGSGSLKPSQQPAWLWALPCNIFYRFHESTEKRSFQATGSQKVRSPASRQSCSLSSPHNSFLHLQPWRSAQCLSTLLRLVLMGLALLMLPLLGSLSNHEQRFVS